MRGHSGTRTSSPRGARSRTRARSLGNTCKHGARRSTALAKAAQCGHANPGAEWRPDAGRRLTTHPCRSVELDQRLNKTIWAAGDGAERQSEMGVTEIEPQAFSAREGPDDRPPSEGITGRPTSSLQ